MAKYGSKDVGFFLMDGYSLLGYTTELAPKKSRRTEDTTVLGDTWEASALTGIRGFEMTQNGFYDDAANASNAALLANSASRVGCIGFEGNTIAKRFMGIAGTIQGDYERIASRGALHKANATYTGNGAIEEGVILATHAARALAASPTATVDNSASSASGGSGYLQVSSITLGGYDSITVKIRHSTDDVTYADLIAFTTVAAAPNAQRSTVAGTVNRYTHTTLTGVGSGSSESITYMSGLYRG